MKGMILGIYENKRIGNCSNNGVSSKYNEVLLVGDDVPEIFEAGDMPVVKIVKRQIGGSEFIHAEPVDPAPSGMIGYMMGGSFIHSSDSRVRRIAKYPIPLHDRAE